VRIDLEKLREMGRKRGLTMNGLLATAGVSKTAFYHLVHKDSVLPASLVSIARTLSAPPAPS
jgi:hypothetical protein